MPTRRLSGKVALVTGAGREMTPQHLDPCFKRFSALPPSPLAYSSPGVDDREPDAGLDASAIRGIGPVT